MEAAANLLSAVKAKRSELAIARRARIIAEIKALDADGIEDHADLDGALACLNGVDYLANPNWDFSELPSEQHRSAYDWADGFKAEAATAERQVA